MFRCVFYLYLSRVIDRKPGFSASMVSYMERPGLSDLHNPVTGQHDTSWLDWMSDFLASDYP